VSDNAVRDSILEMAGATPPDQEIFASEPNLAA
jgi:hypothetical protein